MARVPDEATAFGHRSAKLMVNIAAIHERPGAFRVVVKTANSVSFRFVLGRFKPNARRNVGS